MCVRVCVRVRFVEFLYSINNYPIEMLYKNIISISFVRPSTISLL
jgi:hypothetical protein